MNAANAISFLLLALALFLGFMGLAAWATGEERKIAGESARSDTVAGWVLMSAAIGLGFWAGTFHG